MADSNFDVVKAGAKEVITLLSADGAIPVRAGTYHITKGSAAALTLAAPVAGQDDGMIINILSETAFAHTVTNSSPGFNNLGAAGDVATFGAIAAANRLCLRARNGIWWVIDNLNATIT